MVGLVTLVIYLFVDIVDALVATGLVGVTVIIYTSETVVLS